MTSGHEDEGSRSIPGRSGQTIGAVIDGTGQTVEKALRDGLSIRAVAKATGTSTASVQRIKRSMLTVEEDRLESVAS